MDVDRRVSVKSWEIPRDAYFDGSAISWHLPKKSADIQASHHSTKRRPGPLISPSSNHQGKRRDQGRWR